MSHRRPNTLSSTIRKGLDNLNLDDNIRGVQIRHMHRVETHHGNHRRSSRNHTSHSIQHQSIRKSRLNGHSVLSSLNHRDNRSNHLSHTEGIHSGINRHNRAHCSTLVDHLLEHSVVTEALRLTLVVLRAIVNNRVLTARHTRILALRLTERLIHRNDNLNGNRVRSSSIRHNESVVTLTHLTRNTRNHSSHSIHHQSSRKRRRHSHSNNLSSSNHRNNRLNLLTNDVVVLSHVQRNHRRQKSTMTILRSEHSIIAVTTHISLIILSANVQHRIMIMLRLRPLTNARTAQTNEINRDRNDSKARSRSIRNSDGEHRLMNGRSRGTRDDTSHRIHDHISRKSRVDGHSVLSSNNGRNNGLNLLVSHEHVLRLSNRDRRNIQSTHVLNSTKHTIRTQTLLLSTVELGTTNRRVLAIIHSRPLTISLTIRGPLNR